MATAVKERKNACTKGGISLGLQTKGNALNRWMGSTKEGAALAPVAVPALNPT
jgi:hypothetical protein